VCAQEIGEDDASRSLTVGSLDTREWLTLRRLGISATGALAAVDADRFFDAYYADTSHHLTADGDKSQPCRA
jgi:hypothetical protein